MLQTENYITSNRQLGSPFKKYLAQIEFALLCLVIAVLPTFEAPKQIFWGLYFITAITRLIINRSLLDFKWPDLFFGLWLATALASTIGAGMPGNHEWKGFKDLFMYSSTAWLLYRSNYTPTQLKNLLMLSVIFALPPLLWGMWLHLGPTHKNFLELNSVGNVNHSAIYLSIAFGVSLSFTLYQQINRGIFQKIFFFIITTLFFISIVISESRAALGITIILSIFLFMLLSSNKKIRWLGFGLISLSILTIVIANPVILQKHKSNVANSNALAGRAEVWNVSMEAAKWHPLIGLGMDNWKYITPHAIKVSVEKRGEIYVSDNYSFPGHSHNLYLTVFVERGILGITTLMLILLAWGVKLYKSYQICKANHQLIIWGSSLSAYIIATSIGIVNTTIHHEHGIFTAICLGIFLAITRPEYKEFSLSIKKERKN
jgi:O-antigen ligase